MKTSAPDLMHSLLSAPHQRTRILKTYDRHGAYAWHLGDLYFLAAAELNDHLEPGKAWDELSARVLAATRLIAAIEADPRAQTPGGSFRFEDALEYRRHRRNLRRALSLYRRAWKLHRKVEAVAAAG